MMKLTNHPTVNFFSDGTDTLTFDITDPPLSISDKKQPSALVNPDFRTVSRVPAAPFMKTCTLTGTEVTAVFAAPLPESDISQQPAVYSLAFDLVY